MTTLRDNLINYINKAVDVDDLEKLCYHIRSHVAIQKIEEWELPWLLRRLRSDLKDQYNSETDDARKSKIRAAISLIESDFFDYIFETRIDAGNNPHNEY